MEETLGGVGGAGFDSIYGIFESGHVLCNDYDVGSFCSEVLGDAEAEALRTACDDDGAVGDGEVVFGVKEGHDEGGEGYKCYHISCVRNECCHHEQIHIAGVA